jgi:hypothetical protein
MSVTTSVRNSEQDATPAPCWKNQLIGFVTSRRQSSLSTSSPNASKNRRSATAATASRRAASVADARARKS